MINNEAAPSSRPGDLPGLMRRNLERYKPLSARVTDNERPAAVALCVVDHPDHGEALLLTLRASHLKRHGGQYALPGGRLDRGEKPVTAALRELHEELGLALPVKAVLGQLDDFITRSGFCITPFVVWAGNGDGLVADPDEVAAVHYIPLEQLRSDNILHQVNVDKSASLVQGLYLPVLGHYIYAPTAAMIYQFREVALLGRKTKVVDFKQPIFAQQ